MSRHFESMILSLIVLISAVAPAGMGASTGLSQEKQEKPELITKRDPEKERQRLEKAIRHELVMLPFYSVFDNLAFKLTEYKVELIGQVTRPTLKSDAERVVNSIEGVESVTNNIEVLPVSPNDGRIRQAVYRAIYLDAALQRYAWGAVPPIHIIVKNGHVTLEGVVATESDKNLANVRANGVSGVFSVTNHLRVEKE
jgi:hyperosmotically inducible protein